MTPPQTWALLAAQYRKMSRWGLWASCWTAWPQSTKTNGRHHAALAEKARAGDLDAIRLYRETMAQAGSGNEVTIVDDI